MSQCDDRTISSDSNAGKPWGDPEVLADKFCTNMNDQSVSKHSFCATNRYPLGFWIFSLALNQYTYNSVVLTVMCRDLETVTAKVVSY
jgi:hypothetical protein